MDNEYLSAARSFIAQNAGGTELGDDDDIFAIGAVSSLFAVQLVMWIERTFGISVQAADLDIANFRTIGDTGRFIASRAAAGRRVPGQRVPG
jgi:methoxymalonate biosynthesis acyl carrier protein